MKAMLRTGLPTGLWKGLALSFLLLLLGWLGTGCKTPETAENDTSRPWNAPRGWESGLPGFRSERR